jgi:hypothetical protein
MKARKEEEKRDSVGKTERKKMELLTMGLTRFLFGGQASSAEID